MKNNTPRFLDLPTNRFRNTLLLAYVAACDFNLVPRKLTEVIALGNFAALSDAVAYINKLLPESPNPRGTLQLVNCSPDTSKEMTSVINIWTPLGQRLVITVVEDSVVNGVPAALRLDGTYAVQAHEFGTAAPMTYGAHFDTELELGEVITQPKLPLADDYFLPRLVNAYNHIDEYELFEGGKSADLLKKLTTIVRKDIFASSSFPTSAVPGTRLF